MSEERQEKQLPENECNEGTDPIEEEIGEECFGEDKHDDDPLETEEYGEQEIKQAGNGIKLKNIVEEGSFQDLKNNVLILDANRGQDVIQTSTEAQLGNVQIKQEVEDFDDTDQFIDLNNVHPESVIFKEEVPDNDIDAYEESIKFNKEGENNNNKKIPNKKKDSQNYPLLYGCDLCDYKCRYPSSIKRHRLCHTGETPYACDQCSFVCSQSGNLKRHKYLHSDRKVFSCDMCPFTCIQFEYLKTHILTHLPEKPIKCEQCNYKCVSQKLLKVHMMKHTQERPFGCDECSYSSRSVANLRIHKRIHTGEKPFKCELCSFSCRQNGHLESHKLTHLSAKRFACPVCSFATKNASSLRYHQLTHTGERPFACHLCNYTCKLANQQKLHFKRIHKIVLADRRTQAFKLASNLIV